MSDCNRCLWATRNGSCASWDCRFVDQREAYEAYNRGKADANKWIPVSERLPKRDEVVLVTYKTTDKIHLCKYLDDTSENAWWSYIDDCCAWNNVVLAWMPLPPAYKEEEE